MSDFIDTMFSDNELVRSFNGSGIQTGELPDSVMARGCRTVARYAIAKFIASQVPALERLADATERMVVVQEQMLKRQPLLEP